MKHLLFICSIMLSGFVSLAQTAKQTANYEAANWKTWVIENVQQINIPAPPDAAVTKKELLILKQNLNQLNDKKRAEIRYWNAGAPSHRWNQISASLVSWNDVNTVLRMPSSWMNVAMYDATIIAWKEKLKYKRARPHNTDPTIKPVIAPPATYSYPCEHSVSASAAAHVLAYFYPKKADSVLQLARHASQSRIDAGVQYASDVDAGWKLGEQVAKQVIEKAKEDGSALKWDGAMNKDPKKWTGPYPLGIMLAKYTPLVITTADQFRPPPPPDFENEMKELKEFKPNFKTNSLAYYWANTGAELWIDLAAKKMFEYRIADNAPEVVRIYTILNVASRDAAIATMDAKYAYWGVRPTQIDTTYKPLIATPPFPGYPSGHALGAATSAAVLSYFFPADANEFHKLAQDCADSRYYAGIHFKTDNEAGLQVGREIGKYVAETWIKKTTKENIALKK